MSATPPERSLGLPSATALVVASMIGTGVFTTSGFLLADLGSKGLVLAVWALGGVVAMLGAASYGALARRIPESGGEYVFLSRTLHPAAGYLAGWVSLLVGFSAPLAAAALAFAAYAGPWLPAWLPPRLAASALLAATAAVHAVSLRGGARVQTAAVLLEAALVAGLVAMGLAAGGRAPEGEPAAPFRAGAFAVALVQVSFSYAGWNTAVYVASVVRAPERTVPAAMILGAAAVTALYLALNAAFLAAAPASALAGRLDVGRVAAEALGGPALGSAVAALIAFVLVTFVSSMTMAGPHVSARMASDGYLPAALAGRPGSPPRAALLMQLGVALVLVWTAAYQRLLVTIGFALGLSTAATVAGLMRLRLREGAALRVAGWPVVPALFLAFVLGSSGLAAVREPLGCLIGLGALGVGLAAYRLQRALRDRSTSS